jgi:hypothetical protein
MPTTKELCQRGAGGWEVVVLIAYLTSEGSQLFCCRYRVEKAIYDTEGHESVFLQGLYI